MKKKMKKKNSLLYLNIVASLYYCVCVSEQILQYAEQRYRYSVEMNFYTTKSRFELDKKLFQNFT